MIHNKIYISPGCPRHSIALQEQNRGLNGIHSFASLNAVSSPSAAIDRSITHAFYSFFRHFMCITSHYIQYTERLCYHIPHFSNDCAPLQLILLRFRFPQKEKLINVYCEFKPVPARHPHLVNIIFYSTNLSAKLDHQFCAFQASGTIQSMFIINGWIQFLSRKKRYIILTGSRWPP